jgi:hypothetical protein
MRARSNISSHAIYYGQLPVASYSAVLGPAYNVAETEFGLWLARILLIQIKYLNPDRVLLNQMVEHFIRTGDEVWNNCMNELEQEAIEMLDAAFYSLLDDTGLEVPHDNVVIPDVYDVFDLTADEEEVNVGEEDVKISDIEVDINEDNEMVEIPDNQIFQMDALPEYTSAVAVGKVIVLLIPFFNGNIESSFLIIALIFFWF